MKSLKQKLNSNALTIGSWITLGSSAIAEIMANAGFDWLTVDMEHSVISLGEAQDIIRVIDLAGCVPLVRVGENDPTVIKRVMDAGAHGVIVPMVNTADDAVRAVAAVKYPPEGARGVGLARAQGYGLEFDKYNKWVNKESVVVVQIEHFKAVDNIEEILSVKGVDAVIIGPYDLSASIGRPGEFDDPKVVLLVKRALEAAKAMKKPIGFHVIQPDAGELNARIRQGCKFLAFSLDTLFLGKTCRDLLGAVKKG